MRKLNIVMASLVALPGLSVAAPAAMAATVHKETIRFECPNASGGELIQRLTNFDTSISGMGVENIGSKKTRPVFHGVATAGVPLDLSTGAYSHAGVLYNSHTGAVTCLFKSSMSST